MSPCLKHRVIRAIKDYNKPRNHLWFWGFLFALKSDLGQAISTYVLHFDVNGDDDKKQLHEILRSNASRDSLHPLFRVQGLYA